MDGLDGPSAKKSNSLETLVIQNITNVNDLKAKLCEIIKVGKNYEFDVSNCLTALLHSSDHEIVTLAAQSISELAKCEDKRETFAKKEVIEAILNILRKDVTADSIELVKQCCRALGNLCCDCDTSRKLLLDQDGVVVLTKLLKATLDSTTPNLNEIKLFTSKILLNYGIGGQQFSESIAEGGVIELMRRILAAELDSDDMNDDMVSTALLVLSVISDNTPEFLFEPEVNILVLNILRETTNLEISELCLDHLHAQAEHESVKTVLAKADGVQLVCSRLEQLVARQAARALHAGDADVERLVKHACDLVTIVLTGDEAMHLLYDNGAGPVYQTMVRWLQAPNPHLLGAGVLAVGNFARQDDYCARMMETQIFDKLLDIFEHHYNVTLKQKSEKSPTELITSTKLQHAALSAIRNLTVSAANKRIAAARTRAAPLLLAALPNVDDHHVAYKLLAAIRMLVDGQESVAELLAGDAAALSAAARWGGAGHAGAAGEAPRLLAWAVRQLAARPHCWRHLVQIEGCISSLVNMLVASHSVMQNEAILALTLLAIHCLKDKSADPELDYEKTFVAHLIKSEIGKHVSVLIETNCAKMPIEVVENLLAFLDVTSKVNRLTMDYKEAKVPESLKKLMDARSDLSDDLKSCIIAVSGVIANKE